MNRLRGRLDLENFRREHRVRRYLTAGTDPHTQVGRLNRIERLNHLLGRYAAQVAEAGDQ